MHWSLVPAWICVLGTSAAQTVELAPELTALARVKSRMAQTLARQPNYTCVQQVERSQRRLPARKYRLHDVLRIEVALVEGKEMYAWPGSQKFEETDLTVMVSGGAIGTGNFASHARSVFQSSAPRFQFAGSEVVRGRESVRFNYIVPLISSGYRIRVDRREAIVGYHGSFWADPKTNELIRLEVIADDIPPTIGVAEAHDVMDYDRMKIGASEFLLPVASELVMVDLAGNESRNRTRFTSCKQYSGESVLTFAEAPIEEVPTVPLAAERPKQVVELPVDASFDVRLETEIDSRHSAVGDPVVAKLVEHIKHDRRIVVPKGAMLSGRILRLERHRNVTVLDLRFSELESERVHAAFIATIQEYVPSPPSGITTRNLFRLTDARTGRPVGGLYLRSDHVRLRTGHRIRLRVRPAAAENE